MKYPNLERFLDSVKNHVLTVNHDSGLYRDLTVSIPGKIERHFNITTRPGYLMISGDMGCFVFKRTEDMFAFFRNNDYSISPGYWSEKVKAESIFGEGVKKFDSDAVEESLQQMLADFIASIDVDDSDADERIAAATEAINEIDTSSRCSLNDALMHWDEDEAGGLYLGDFFECSTKTYTYYYVWCCYAIVHAIKLYDEYKQSEVA